MILKKIWMLLALKVLQISLLKVFNGHHLDQAPQTRGQREGPMRPAINLLRSRKDEKMTLF
jgi:hypothetical protein